MDSTDKLKQYIEQNRVWGSKVVNSSKRTNESGYYITSKAAEIASILYLGTHIYKDVKSGITELWFTGRSITFAKD